MPNESLTIAAFKELIQSDEQQTTSLSAYKSATDSHLETSLIELLCESDKVTNLTIDFASKHGILTKNDLRFLRAFISKIKFMEKWPVLYHLITNMYDIELLKTMHTDDKQTSLLLHLLFSPIFDERWFKVILHFMDQNKFDLKYKGTNGLTLLDGAIHQNNIFLIQYFICKGLKFTDSTGATGRDFVQSCIYLSKDSLLKRYQTIEACIKYGYDITTKDKNGLTLRDYIEKYIPKKHNGKYIELLR